MSIFILLFIIIFINHAVNGELIESVQGMWAEILSFSLEDGELVEVIGEGKAEVNYLDYKIEGDYIRYQVQTSDIHSKGNVCMNTEDYQLFTEKISAKLEKGTFAAQGEVLFRGSNLEVHSDKLYIEEKEELMTFAGNVILELNEIKAVADTLIYYSANKILFLEGNVSGENEKIEFSGNKMEINLETEQIKLQDGAGMFLKAAGDD